MEMELIVIFIVGFLFGMLSGISLILFKHDGYFRVDLSNEDRDVYLLDMKTDLTKIPKKKIVVLRIDTKYIKTQ